MQLEQSKLDAVIQASFDRAAEAGKNAAAWQRAIAKARQQFDVNPFIHFDERGLLMLSESGHIYESNGTCRTATGELCAAYAKRQPCYHRAAFQILKHYHAGH